MYKTVGPRPLSISGLLVLGGVTLLWSRVNETTGTIPLMLLVAGRGVGLGLFAQTIQLVAYNTVPQGQLPRATALVNVGQRIDGALSTAILTTVLVAGLQIAGAPAGSSIGDGTATVGDMVIAFHYAFLFMTALSFGGAALAWFIHDRVLEDAKAGKRTADTLITPRAEQHGAALPEMAAVSEQGPSTRSA
jgi:hypothetical protein